MKRYAACCLCFFASGLSPEDLSAQDSVNGRLINFLDNGAWSWFEDERAIVDPFRGRILVSSCADASGAGGAARSGDVDVAWLDLSTGRFGRFELIDRLQADDHNSAALLVRPDGRYLAMYGMHGGSGTAPRLSRWRVSVRPGDPTAWLPERAFTHPSAMSYSNLFHLRSNGRTYNFVRARNWDPNVMVSSDQGSTFTGAGKLLTEGGTGDRPYVKYASNGQRRIHVLTTERHPRNFENSIYHGYVENDQLHDSFGAVVDPDVLDLAGQPPSRLTAVFRNRTVVNGVSMRRAWTIDLAVDEQDNVRALFQARANDAYQDHRLFFAAFRSGGWVYHEVCRLGTRLYGAESDYTGLAALDPNDAGTLFVSTYIDPRSGVTLPRHEIFRATTSDGGANWTFAPITENSSVDNLRPICPSWDDDRTAVLWMRGTYSSYTDYDLAVVGIVDAPELQFGALDYLDATVQNTTLVGGGAANPTGPSAGQGPNDDRWHLRTGFGNGGQVWTASELGSENAPTLRTRVAGLTPGPHDVFVNFWSNPNEDWVVRAGLSANSLRIFEKRGAARAEQAHFNTPVQRTGPTVQLYSVWIGRAKVSAGVLDVFVDDLDSGQGGRGRSWYDGIATVPTGRVGSAQTVGRGCNGNAELRIVGVPRLGGSVQFGLVSGSPGAAGFAIVGFGELTPTPLSPASGCVLLVPALATVSLGALDPSGATPLVSAPIPGSSTLQCARIGFQGATLGATLQLTPARVLLPGR